MKKILKKINDYFSYIRKEKINAMVHCGRGFN